MFMKALTNPQKSGLFSIRKTVSYQSLEGFFLGHPRSQGGHTHEHINFDITITKPGPWVYLSACARFFRLLCL